jgi:hypothetical protein
VANLIGINPAARTTCVKTADVNLMIIMREEEEEFFDFWLGTSTRRLVLISPMPLLVVPNINHFSINK